MSRWWGSAKRTELGYRILHRREVITDTGMGMGCSIYGGVLHSRLHRGHRWVLLYWAGWTHSRRGQGRENLMTSSSFLDCVKHNVWHC